MMRSARLTACLAGLCGRTVVIALDSQADLLGYRLVFGFDPPRFVFSARGLRAVLDTDLAG